MAKYGPKDIVVQYDNSGGTPVDITQYVLSINGVSVQQLLEQSNSFGDDWEEHLPIELAKVDVIELGGIYDDTATTGPDALFANRVPEAPSTSARTLTLTWGGSKTTSVETHLLSYDRNPTRDGLTKYTARLQPTGSVTEV